MRKTLGMLLAVTLLAATTFAADAPKTRPHPMFTRMDGYYVSKTQEQAFASREFRVGSGKKQAVEGRLLNVGYLREKGLPAQTSLAVIRNHENAIKAMGGEVLDIQGSASNPTYLTFRVTKNGETTWGEIDTTAGGNDWQITTVTVQAMKQEVTAKELGEGIARDGKVALYDILFDTGKATLRPESDRAVATIAELLKANPNLKLFVVGHTDNVGTLASNLALSEQRGQTVVQALVGKHGIQAARLTGKGVGQLVPVASNATEEGRQKNRRVEVVAQ